MEFGKLSRATLISEVADRTAQPKMVIGHIYNELLEVILENLKDGKEVLLTGIGTFHFIDKKESRSNLTKQLVPPHKQIKCRMNKMLARYIRVTTRK